MSRSRTFWVQFLVVSSLLTVYAAPASAVVTLTLNPTSISVEERESGSISWSATGAPQYQLFFESGFRSWMSAKFETNQQSQGFIEFDPPQGTAGTYPVTFKVCRVSTTDCDSANFTVTVTTEPVPLSVDVSNFSVDAGRPIVQPFSVSGGLPPYITTITSGNFSNGDRPFANANDQRIYCQNDSSCRVPTSSQTVNFQMRVTDQNSVSITDNFSISVATQPTNYRNYVAVAQSL